MITVFVKVDSLGPETFTATKCAACGRDVALLWLGYGHSILVEPLGCEPPATVRPELFVKPHPCKGTALETLRAAAIARADGVSSN